MNFQTGKKVEEITQRAEEVFDEIDIATEGDATLEDRGGAKALAAGLLDQCESLLKELSPLEKAEVEETLKGIVEEVKEKMLQLKEAPE